MCAHFPASFQICEDQFEMESEDILVRLLLEIELRLGKICVNINLIEVLIITLTHIKGD